MEKPNTNQTDNKVLCSDEIEASADLGQYLSDNDQILLPVVNLIEQSKLSLDELINQIGRLVIEGLLKASAAQLAGPKQQGKRNGGKPIQWHGTQAGSVSLSERKIKVNKPRLREKGKGGREVEIPLYRKLQNNRRLSERILEIMLCGVSTRKYQQVLPKAAKSAGIRKSSISRQFIYQSGEQLKKLCERPIDGDKILIVYIDGMVFGKHHMIAAIGVDQEGHKQVLGVSEGASENATVVKGLLVELQQRGLKANRKRLFVIDGSKALRSAIDEVYGIDNFVQRCRKHKIENVMGYLPDYLRDQVRSAMRAAYKLPFREGVARLKKQIEWLQREHPRAASSLLEGLEETFTVNRMDLAPSLQRVLCTTNIIESPNAGIRRTAGRVSRWESGEMVLRWAAAAFLHVEKRFNRLMGCSHLWMLKAALSDGAVSNNLAKNGEAA